MFNDFNIPDIGASRLVSLQAQLHYIDMTLAHYYSTLASSDVAVSYLTKTRGLTMPVIQQFEVGYCDRSLGKTLPDTESFEGGMVRGTLQRFGLLKPNGRELFRGCIVVPIKDESGALVDMYGRKVAKYQRRGIPFYLRIHNVPVSLFNAQALLMHRNIVLCASPIEALSLLSCGVLNVVSLTGIDSLSVLHAEQLQANGVTHVTIGLANTPQGQRYRVLLIQMLKSLGIEHSELMLPSGEDINSVLVKAQHMQGLCKQLGVSLPRSAACH